MTSAKSMRELLLEATELEKAISQREQLTRSSMTETRGTEAGQPDGLKRGAEDPGPGQGSPQGSA